MREDALSCFQRLCVRVLRFANIPRHVAFVMDGNRRFAKQKGLGVEEAHSWGFDKMAEALQWCLELGVSEVTVFAFSVANFGRRREEVEALMGVARHKLRRLLEEAPRFRDLGIRVRFVGELQMLPLDVRALASEAETATLCDGPRVINVAMAYSSRAETLRVLRGETSTTLVGAPDLLLRTSGVARLSDFLLWQTTASSLQFVDVLWPELSFWHLALALLRYQEDRRHLAKVGPWTWESVLP